MPLASFGIVVARTASIRTGNDFAQNRDFETRNREFLLLGDELGPAASTSKRKGDERSAPNGSVLLRLPNWAKAGVPWSPAKVRLWPKADLLGRSPHVRSRRAALGLLLTLKSSIGPANFKNMDFGMQTVTFTGTAEDVQAKATVWKWAHPDMLVLRESELATGDNCWELTIGYSRRMRRDFADPAKDETPRSV